MIGKQTSLIVRHQVSNNCALLNISLFVEITYLSCGHLLYKAGLAPGTKYLVLIGRRCY